VARNDYTPPKPPDTAPLVRLREHLQAARARDEAFAHTWSPAVALALEGLRGPDRREWATAIARTRETWQNAYERRPQSQVGQQLELIRDGRDVPVIERPCRQCGRERPPRSTVFCGSACRRAEWREQRRAA
jgi:hypothetical protein